MPDTIVNDRKVFLLRSDAERKPLIQRLARIEGQVRGIRQMIEEDRHCGDEIQQIKAAMAALRETGLAIVEQHVAAAAGVLDQDRSGAIADIMTVLREAARL